MQIAVPSPFRPTKGFHHAGLQPSLTVLTQVQKMSILIYLFIPYNFPQAFNLRPAPQAGQKEPGKGEKLLIAALRRQTNQAHPNRLFGGNTGVRAPRRARLACACLFQEVP